jgi:hypothetical protein
MPIGLVASWPRARSATALFLAGAAWGCTSLVGLDDWAASSTSTGADGGCGTACGGDGDAATGSTSGSTGGSGGGSSSGGAGDGGAGAGQGALCSQESIGVLQDSFDDGQTDTALWTGYDGGGASVSEEVGFLSVFVAESTAGSYAGYWTLNPHDLRGCGVALQVPTVTSEGTNAETYLAVTSVDGTEMIVLKKEAGMLHFQHWSMDVLITNLPVDYDSTAHAYWQVLHVGGTSWKGRASSDGVIWQELGTLDVDAPELAETARVNIGAGSYQPEVMPGGAEFRNLVTSAGN